MLWRGRSYEGPAPPEPWPGRYEAFLSACAMFAGHRERELLDVVEGLSGALAEKEPAIKQRNPMRSDG